MDLSEGIIGGIMALRMDGWQDGLMELEFARIDGVEGKENRTLC